MADVLQTVLQLVGGQAYVRSLNQATQAHQQLARAQQQQARAQAQVAQAMAGGRAPSARQQATAGGAGLPPTVFGLPQAAILAGVTAAAVAIKDATAAFLDYDRAVIRADLTMKNMGRGLPIPQLKALARELALTTGTQETELVNLGGYLARFSTDAPTMSRAMRVINDAALATGMSVDEMARSFEKARTGHAKAFFKELGIPIRGVEGQLYSLDQIVSIVERHFHDFGIRFGRELPGEVDRAAAAMKVMANETGRLLGPLTKWWAEFKIGLALAGAGAAHLAAKALGIPEAGALAGGATPGQGSLGGPARPKSEEYLRRIEMNTGPQGALGRALRGGGAYGEPGGGLPIRTFASMFRHTH